MPPKFRRIAFDLNKPDTRNLFAAALAREKTETQVFEGFAHQPIDLGPTLRDKGRMAVVSLPGMSEDEQESEGQQLKSLAGVHRVGPVVRTSARWVSFLTSDFVVRFASRGAARSLIPVIENDYDVKQIRRLPYVPGGFLFRAGQVRRRIVDICLEIMTRFDSDVHFAEPDLVTNNIHLANPGDALYDQQWNLHEIHAGDAWQSLGKNLGAGLQYGRPEVRVAVVDSQIDVQHSEFGQKLSNDDPRIFDPQYDFYWIRAGELPPHYHGTGVAGIIGAGPNDHDIVGVAPNCQIVNVALTIKSTVELADAMFWSAGFHPLDPNIIPPLSPPADVISASWDKLMGDTEAAMLETLASAGRDGRGTVMVFAAGEPDPDGDYTFAMSEHVVTVAAFKKDDTNQLIHNPVSRSGDFVDVAAPSDVNTTGTDNPYQSFDGTSAATPHVSGVVALMLSTNPYLTWDQVRDILRNTADGSRLPIPPSGATDPYGNIVTFGDLFGYGAVHAHDAVDAAWSMLPLLTPSIGESQPNPAAAGEPVGIEIKVVNDGQTESPPTLLKVQTEFADLVGVGVVVTEYEVPPVPPGGTHTVLHKQTFLQSGRYRVLATTDAGRNIHGAVGVGPSDRRAIEVG